MYLCRISILVVLIIGIPQELPLSQRKDTSGGNFPQIMFAIKQILSFARLGHAKQLLWVQQLIKTVCINHPK